MEFLELRKEITRIIDSALEGQEEILNYSQNKFEQAGEVLDYYGEKFTAITGQRIDFQDRYLSDRQSLIMHKAIPNLYQKWKYTGLDKRGSVADIVMTILNYYENHDSLKTTKPEEIISRIQDELKASNINEAAANRITDEIADAIHNSKYYSEKSMGMYYQTDNLTEDFSYDMKKVILSIRPEEIIEILSLDENQMMNKIGELIVRYQSEKEPKKKSTAELQFVDPSELQENEASTNKGLRQQFLDELHQEVDVNEAVQKHEDKQQKEQDKTIDGESNKNKKHLEDLFL